MCRCSWRTGPAAGSTSPASQVPPVSKASKVVAYATTDRAICCWHELRGVALQCVACCTAGLTPRPCAGMEAFGIDPDELATALQRRFQSSASVTKLPGKNETGGQWLRIERQYTLRTCASVSSLQKALQLSTS